MDLHMAFSGGVVAEYPQKKTLPRSRRPEPAPVPVDKRLARQASKQAAALAKKGKLAEAERFYREAVEAKRSAYGNEHPSTLFSINNLANVLQAQGKRQVCLRPDRCVDRFRTV